MIINSINNFLNVVYMEEKLKINEKFIQKDFGNKPKPNPLRCFLAYLSYQLGPVTLSECTLSHVCLSVRPSVYQTRHKTIRIKFVQINGRTPFQKQKVNKNLTNLLGGTAFETFMFLMKLYDLLVLNENFKPLKT